MTELEQQLAILLNDAPGEPPVTLDPDTVRLVPVRRPRNLAPLLTAAAVLVVALSVAGLLERGSPNRAPADRPGLSGPFGTPSSARKEAIRTVETIIETAPMVPGASRRGSAPLASLSYARSAPAGQYVHRTRFWTAPGTIEATISYLQAHPPTGMIVYGSGRSIGPGGALRASSLDFRADKYRYLGYAVMPYHRGVAVRADAQVVLPPDPNSVPTSVTTQVPTAGASSSSASNSAACPPLVSRAPAHVSIILTNQPGMFDHHCYYASSDHAITLTIINRVFALRHHTPVTVQIVISPLHHPAFIPVPGQPGMYTGSTNNATFASGPLTAPETRRYRLPPIPPGTYLIQLEPERDALLVIK